MKRWIHIKIELETISPLHIGGVRDPFSDVDNPIVLIGDEPQIPGSTLKGNWRYSIEEFLIDSYYDSKGKLMTIKEMTPCIPNNDPSPDEKQLINNGKYKSNCLTKEERDDPICPACYLHGAPSLRGFVRTPFLKLVPGQIEPMIETVELLWDRATELGSGAEGRRGGGVRNVSMVRPDVYFEGVIDILARDPVKDWILGGVRHIKGKERDVWLRSGWENKPRKIFQDFVIDRLQGERTLGGYQSKGYGKVRIQLSAPESGPGNPITLDEYLTKELKELGLPTN